MSINNEILTMGKELKINRKNSSQAILKNTEILKNDKIIKRN